MYDEKRVRLSHSVRKLARGSTLACGIAARKNIIDERATYLAREHVFDVGQRTIGQPCRSTTHLAQRKEVRQ
jgi:hypothetical protein